MSTQRSKEQRRQYALRATYSPVKTVSRYSIIRTWRSFAALCIFLLLTASVQAQSGPVEVFYSNFEEAHIIGSPTISTVLQPGQSTVGDTREGPVTITAIGDHPTTVVAGNGIDENGAPGVIIRLEGGPVRMKFDELYNRGTLTHRSTCDIAPTAPATYAISKCWGSREYYHASEKSAYSPIWSIKTGRLPGVNGKAGELVEPPETPPEARDFDWMRIAGGQLMRCSHFACSPLDPDLPQTQQLKVNGRDAVPVLLVHGFQKFGSDGTLWTPGGGGEFLRNNGGDSYYSKLPDRLIADGYYPFEFKWQTNARFTDVADDLAWAIAEIKRVTGKDVHVVAHSFGGVLVRTLMQDNVLGAYGEHTSQARSAIASLTTIGTPHSGISNGIDTFFGVQVPNGQDEAWIFDGCGQISCHVTGEPTLNSRLAKIFEVQLAPGETTAQLATTVDNLPETVKIRVLMGLTTTNGSIQEGDGLIAGDGQRFLPSLALNSSGSNREWHPLLDTANVTEIMLGRDSIADDTSGIEPSTSRPVWFQAYKHSPNVPLIAINRPEQIPQVSMSMVGFHDAYTRIVEGLPPTCGNPGNIPDPDLSIIFNDSLFLELGASKTGTVDFIEGHNGRPAAKFYGVDNSGRLIIPQYMVPVFDDNDGATFDMMIRRDSDRGMNGWGSTVNTGSNQALFSKDHDSGGVALLQSDGGSAGIATFDGTWDVNSGVVINPVDIALGEWHRVTVSASRSLGVDIYINGILYGHYDTPSLSFSQMNAKNLVFGGYRDYWYPFNGAIQDFKIYKRALCHAEVAVLD